MKMSYGVEIDLLEKIDEIGNKDYWEGIDVLDESRYYDTLEEAEIKAKKFKNKLKEGRYDGYIPKGENYRAEVCIFVYHVTEEGFNLLFDVYEF